MVFKLTRVHFRTGVGSQQRNTSSKWCAEEPISGLSLMLCRRHIKFRSTGSFITCGVNLSGASEPTGRERIQRLQLSPQIPPEVRGCRKGTWVGRNNCGKLTSFAIWCCSSRTAVKQIHLSSKRSSKYSSDLCLLLIPDVETAAPKSAIASRDINTCGQRSPGNT